MINNKKILYILTFILTLFIFNPSVNAAQELVCVYEKGLNNDKIMLTQDSSGKLTVYGNKNDYPMHGDGWSVFSTTIKYHFNTGTQLVDTNGYLTKCPAYSELGEIGGFRLHLYETKSALFLQPIESSYTSLSILSNDGKIDIIGDIKTTLTCDDLFSGDEGQDLLNLIKTVFNLIKIAIPVLLIALGILDFTKAIFAGKEDDMKKAQGKFMKRLIIGVCIFIAPSILKLILTIASSIWSNISPDFCGII